MELINTQFAETAVNNSLCSSNPFEDARINKALRDLYERKRPNNAGRFYVPFSLTRVVLEAVQKMVSFDYNIVLINIIVKDLKLEIDYETVGGRRYAPALEEIITSAQSKIDRIIHQRVLMSLNKKKGQ